MQVSVRPYTRMSAALLAAGVVAAAAPVVATPGHGAIPAISNVAVHPASFITDSLLNFGDAVNTGASAVAIPADMIMSLPFDAFYALAIGGGALLQSDPDAELAGSVASWLVQRYLNPSDNYSQYSYPWDLKANVLAPIAGALPAPLDASVISALNGAADAINAALSALPDPTKGASAVSDYWLNTATGTQLRATQLVLLAPVYALAYAVTWAGYLPAEVEAAVEHAIAKPADIPGLISNLVNLTLNPNRDPETGVAYGLLGGVVTPFVDAGSWLSAPIGDTVNYDGSVTSGLATKSYDTVTTVINGLLNLLPAPVSPFADPQTTDPETTDPETTKLATEASAAVSPVAALSSVAVVPSLTKATLAIDVPSADSASATAKQTAVEPSAAKEAVAEAAAAQAGAASGTAKTDAAPAADAAKTDAPAAVDTTNAKSESAKAAKKARHAKSSDASGDAGSSAKARHAKGNDASGDADSSGKPRHAKTDDSSNSSGNAGSSAKSGDSGSAKAAS
jgi:hypothetical protein